MFLFKFLVITLTIKCVLSSAEDDEEIKETDVRSSRDFNPESWRAVETEKIDMSGWIPQDSTTESQQLPVKRRRFRKRKRKPSQQTDFERPKPRPLRLDQNDEVWDDMEQENPKLPSNRRRIVPAYDSDETSAFQLQSEPEIITERLNTNNNPLQAVIRFEDDTPVNKPKRIEKIRDPFDALKEAEEKQKTSTTVSPELKALLKKSGGNISLSEILQKKNISLSELLKGSFKAISALTEEPTESTDESTEATKYNRIPPFERKKITDRVFESTESISSKEMLEAQRKRLSLLQMHKENKIYKGITHTFEIVTEPVTEKRIFVPSHPKHYSTISYKPIILEDTQTTQSMKSTTEKFEPESSNTVIPPSFKKLPITSAKLMTKLTTTKMPAIKPIPPKAIKISLDEILKKTDVQKDEPLKITLNLNIPTTSVSKQASHEMKENEKLRIITAREEILEMLKDPLNKERLSRILQEKNMTIQELVEQRERGSSQLHLADIFHNKTKEPEPIDVFVSVIREEKSRKFEEDPSTTSTTTIKTTTSTEIQHSTLNYAAIMPFWKQFHPEMYNHFYQNTGIYPPPPSDFQRIEEVDNRLSDIVHNKLDVDLQPRNYNLKDDSSMFDVPTGVKSALFASFAIVGLSLFVFVTILVLFRWSQRNKTKFNYIGSISGCSKIKSPILELPQKNAFKSFMCETLGRKSKSNKTHLQSMSDVWDERRQKF